MLTDRFGIVWLVSISATQGKKEVEAQSWEEAMESNDWTVEDIAPDFKQAKTRKAFPKATLVEPTASGYLLIAAEIERRPMFVPDGRNKRELIRQVNQILSSMRSDDRVIEANAFDGLLALARPGKVLQERPDVPRARFDLAVLVETASPEAAAEVERGDLWISLVTSVEAEARRTYRLRAHNVRRMGPVDHRRDGVFLFNYFYADRTDLNLAAWQYTAGWFMDQTGLDNSTVLLPDDTSEVRYRLINHARWDRLRNVLPSLIFKRTFHTYVLEHFRINGVAAMPVLYRLA
jgi:hypothetical protein